MTASAVRESGFIQAFGAGRGLAAPDLLAAARSAADHGALVRLARAGQLDPAELLIALRDAIAPPDDGLREVLRCALYRDDNCAHVIVHFPEHQADAPMPEETLHLTATDLRVSDWEDELALVCGQSLPRDRCYAAERGQWRERFAAFTQVTPVTTCPACAAASGPFAEECAETRDYPALSGSQTAELNTRLTRRLERVVDWALASSRQPSAEVIEDRCLGAYIDALIDMLAEHLGAHPRRVLRDGVFSSGQFDELLKAAGGDERRVCGLLDAGFWTAVLRGYAMLALTVGVTPTMMLACDATDHALRALRRS